MSNGDGASTEWQHWAEQAGRQMWALWSASFGGGTQPAEQIQRSFGLAWQLLSDEYAALAAAAQGDRAALEGVFERLQERLEAASGDTDAYQPPLEEMLTLLQRGYAQAGLSQLSALLPNLGLGGPLPRLGMLQHRQHQVQQTLEALQAQRRASQAYCALLDRAVLEALDECRARLRRLKEQQHSIEGLRQLYDLWLESSEQAYERLLYSESYAEALGQLTNRQVALTRHIQGLFDDMLGAMNLPSRRALRDTQDRLHDLRRTHREVSAQALETHTLRDELQALRRELQELKGERSKSEP